MLVLSRKVNQDIVITAPGYEGDPDTEIIVRILEITSEGQVRLGFKAPDDVTIDRHEIHEAKKAQ